MVIDKEKILGLAQKYVLKGQSDKAIKEYLKLIEASPKDKRLYLKLGDLYLKNGDNEKAIKEYLKLSELFEEEDLNYRAISIYKKVLSINSKSIEALQKIAKLYLKEGLPGSAKNYYQNLLEISPNNPEALKGLETIEHSQQGKEASPLSPAAELRKAIPSQSPWRIKEDETPPPIVSPDLETSSFPSPETEPSSQDKDSEMHYHLGIAYKEMELFDYAISEFELASSNPSMKFDCHMMLGSCFMEKGDYDKSIEYFRKASGFKGLSNEQLAKLHFNLGLAYEANGMVSEAIDTFTLVIKLDHSLSEAQEKIKKLQQI